MGLIEQKCTHTIIKADHSASLKTFLKDFNYISTKFFSNWSQTCTASSDFPPLANEPDFKDLKKWGRSASKRLTVNNIVK